jgi:hypothetical protein
MHAYLYKIEKARAMKEEQKAKEQKVFLTGKNWTRKATVPKAPTLSHQQPKVVK